MTGYLAIAVGGAFGAVSRYWVSSSTYHWLGTGYPWGTLMVNTLGSLVMGFLVVLLSQKITISVEFRMALLIGFLGSFTTFSTFAYDALQWFEAGATGKAVSYVVLSVLFSLIAVTLGFFAAKHF